MTEMQLFSKMLEIVKENGGTYRGGNSWDTIWFTGDDHIEVSERVFNELKEMGVNVYSLSHTITNQSLFNYK